MKIGKDKERELSKENKLGYPGREGGRPGGTTRHKTWVWSMSLGRLRTQRRYMTPKVNNVGWMFSPTNASIIEAPHNTGKNRKCSSGEGQTYICALL